MQALYFCAKNVGHPNKLTRKLSRIFVKDGGNSTAPILTKKGSSNQNSQKLSAREFPSTVKSQKFSSMKLKCYTVLPFTINIYYMKSICWIPQLGIVGLYTRQTKKLVAFSFAKFEMTTGSTGKANISFLSNYLILDFDHGVS